MYGNHELRIKQNHYHEGESSGNDFTIPVPDLKQGIYFPRLISNDGMSQKKMKE